MMTKLGSTGVSENGDHPGREGEEREGQRSGGEVDDDPHGLHLLSRLVDRVFMGLHVVITVSVLAYFAFHF